MRNASIPSGAQVSESSFRECYDLLRLFGSEEMIIDELTSRFKELPIHKLCYYQTEDAIELLASTGLIPDNDEVSLIVPSVVHARDCLGMTPLHILPCSSAQNLGLYRFIVANSPSSLITEDKWGCVPLLYAIWGDAPQEIVNFLIDAHKSAVPNRQQRAFETSTNTSSLHFLVKCNIAERLNKIGVRKWRMGIKNHQVEMEMLSSDDLMPLFDINSELVTYEQEYSRLEEAAFLLELALWKSKIDGSMAIVRRDQ